jgi:hypothetical protein
VSLAAAVLSSRHTFTVLSSLLLASHCPSGLKATCLGTSEWPVNVC